MKKSLFNKNRKRSFTLLELLMSLSLSAIIITLLLTFTFKLFLTERKIKIAKQELLADTELEIKLRSLFSELILDASHHKTTPTNTQKNKNTNPNNTIQNNHQSFDFYTDKKENKLFFLFDAHVDHNPLFSGQLKGELFLDEHQNLILTTRSLTEAISPKTEVLATHIQALKFTFLKRKEAQYPGDSTYLSSSQWEEKESPAVMQITIQKEEVLELSETQKKKIPLKLTFFLDNMKSSIVCFGDK